MTDLSSLSADQLAELLNVSKIYLEEEQREAFHELLGRARRLKAAEDALERIHANAVSWHGPKPLESGHVAALSVIADWSRNAMSRSSDPNHTT